MLFEFVVQNIDRRLSVRFPATGSERRDTLREADLLPRY